MSAKAFHQLVHTLSYGDAISGEVLALRRAFNELGYESEIYAINIHPKYKSIARDYRQFDRTSSGEAILHYSIGSPLNTFFQELAQAQRCLIYHNLTPAFWFQGVNPRIVADIERGSRELPGLCATTPRLIADSSFNAAELTHMGFNAQVLELPIDPERWAIEANAGILDLVAAEPGIHLLHVGRLAPNKCIEDIIKIFYFLHHYIEPHSRLWLAGIDIDTELYSFSLKRLVHQLELDEFVTFGGCMADSEIKALYQSASVYLCMSEHEGFCLPVIEAMHFGLPVIAYASSATPDTVGEGGILVTEKRHPELAELAALACRDTVLRDRLKGAGKTRSELLSFGNFRERVKKAFSLQ